MKNLKLSKYWSANLLALAGYIFTPIGIYLFFFLRPHIINSGTDIFIWYDIILKYYGVYLPVFGILAITWWIQSSTDDDEKTYNNGKIKEFIFKTGIFCCIFPLLFLIAQIIYHTLLFDFLNH